MANEFNIKNGFITSGNSFVYANLNVLSGITATTISATTISQPFTTGSVIFQGSGGTLSQNNSNLFWNNTNNRFGINTSTPNDALHVIGAGIFSSAISISGGFVMTEASNVHTFTAPATNRTIRFITNSQSYSLFPTGNFTIGTTTDSGFKLDVNGTTRSGDLTIGTLGSSNTISFGGGVNNTIFRDVGEGSLNFRNTFSNSINFRFRTNSDLPNANTGGTNVFMSLPIGFAPTSGTGTWTQLSLSHTINQTGGASGITRGLYIQPTLTSAADYRTIEWTNTTGYGLYGSGSAPNYLQGNTLIGTTTNAGFKLDVNGVARVSGDITLGGWIRTPQTGNLIVNVGNFAMNLTTNNPQNGSGSLITTGDITRTDSQTKNIIDINNSVSSTSASFNTLNGYTFTSTINQTLGIIRGVYIAPTLTSSTDFRAIQTTVGNVLFNTVSGNTLIGTSTNAGYKLDVNGTGRFTDNVLLSSSKGVYFGNVGYGISGETGIGTVSLVTNSIQRLRIDNSGNINASTAPTAAISDIYISGSTIEFRNGLHYFSWENTGNVFQIKNISNANTIPFIVFKSTNNIGIGTTTDSGYKLDVNGSLRVKNPLTASGPIAIFDGNNNPYQNDAYISVGSSNGPNYAQFGTTNISPNFGGIIQWNGSSPSMAFDNNRVSIANGAMPLVALGANPPTTKGSVFTVGGYNNLINLLPSEIGLQFSVLPKSLRIYGGSNSTNLAINSFGVSNVQSYFYNTTATNVQTVYIDGPPTVSGSLTATTFWSLYVNSGQTYFGGNTMVKGTKGTVTTDGSTSTALLTFSGSNTIGGTGYTDFIRVTNTAAGATNPTKTIRVNNTGGIEFINNAYTTQILNLTDDGVLSVGGGNTAATSNNDPTTNYLSFNNNGTSIYDDGNTHIHSRSNGGSMWINTNNGAIILGNQSPVLGGGTASGIIMGSGSTTTRAFANIYGGKTYTIGGYGYLATIGAGTGGGTTATYGLYVQQRVEATEFDATSDERLKNIQGEIELDAAIKLVNNLKPIKFTWKNKDNEGIKAGYSAQQVVKSGFNHLIGHIKNEDLKETTDDEGFTSPEGFQLTMNYDQVTPYHGVVIKHLLEEIENLKKEIKILKNKIV